MQRYLRIQVPISVIVGIATGLAYWAIGVETTVCDRVDDFRSPGALLER